MVAVDFDLLNALRVLLRELLLDHLQNKSHFVVSLLLSQMPNIICLSQIIEVVSLVSKGSAVVGPVVL